MPDNTQQLTTAVAQFISKHCSFLHTGNNCILVAVSGGIDSVVLLDVLAKSRIKLAVAHCNFQLRGEESDSDEQFVKSLSEQYGIPFYCKKFDTNAFAKANQLSIQESARNLRYEWFNQLLADHKFAYVATAHHADDQVETVLMNIFRGTGIAGLHGILPVQGKVIRPLLDVKRLAILEYANQYHIKWVEDASNASDKYSRNFIRHHIIPAAQAVYPNAVDNILASIERWREAEIIYNDAVIKIKQDLFEIKQHEIHIPVLKWKKQVPLQTITFELLQPFGFDSKQTSEAIKLLDAHTGSYIASASHRLIKNRNWMIIAPLQQDVQDNIIIDVNDSTVVFDQHKLELRLIESKNYQLQTVNHIAAIDAAKISFPLVLRKWKQGDYFYPLGMTKKKKLSKFFIDQKLSKTEKEQCWILTSGDKIVWVVGHRMDNRFKLTPNTKKILLLTVKL